jgi:histidyl-tRNA synthetase
MKPTLPKGTRDFSPLEMSRRNYIFDTIRAVFRTYGYQPIETPAMENLSTLTGKYGNEGDKLIFKILNSGDIFNKQNILSYYNNFRDDAVQNYFLEYINTDEFKNLSDEANEQFSINVREKIREINDNPTISENQKNKTIIQYILDNPNLKSPVQYINEYIKEKIPVEEIAIDSLAKELKENSTEKALRYDLTVPFARYVVMNRNDITFPFKRYQVQPVWRADRPQKGRYREFYQFDADVVGSPSLVYEAEFFQIFAEVFKRLGTSVTIKYNNRKVLNGITEAIGAEDKFTEVVTIIDKLDKIGVDKVNEELAALGVTPGGIEKLQTLFNLQGTDAEKLDKIKSTVFPSFIGLKGIEELQTVLGYLEAADFDSSVMEFDPSLARGLSYYTGAIFEVKAHGVQIGSICGGGRYDDLTGLFGLPNVSGVGISFGVDRIYDVLNELNLFPETMADAAKVLVTNFGVDEEKFSFNLVTRLRAAGINADMYPTQAKLGKQFEYADKKKIPYVAVVGADEMATGRITLKDMVSGVQEKHFVDELIGKLK